MAEPKNSLSDKIEKWEKYRNGDYPLYNFIDVNDVKEAVKQLKKEINKDMKHTTEDPSNCGCYMCHNQGEFRQFLKEWRDKIDEIFGKELTK